jgi:hypothetical protein
MLRAMTVLLSLTILAACVTSDAHIASKSEKLTYARAAASPVMLGTAY